MSAAAGRKKPETGSGSIGAGLKTARKGVGGIKFIRKAVPLSV
jgi:hypothetical protein